MKKVSFIIFIFCFFIQFVFAQNDVAMLAENCSYQGKRVYLQPGVYKAYQLGVRNNELSSFHLPDGMALQVFEDDNYRGRTETFYSSVSCLSSTWNNRVSSLKIFWIHDPGNEGNGSGNSLLPQGSKVIVYSEVNYTGIAKEVGIGNFGMSISGMPSENISSIYIPYGLTVKVNDKNNISQTFTSSVADLYKIRWNQRINSGYIDNNNSGGNSGSTLPPQGDRVILYRDIQFSGPAKALDNGVFTVDIMGSLLREQSSSIYIPYGSSMQVFDRNGRSQHFSNSITNLSNYGWDNKIYSGSITKNGSNTSTVKLYSDADYRGNLTPCSEGRINFIGNNAGISSIELPPGFAVTVYQGQNLTGNSKTFTSSVTNLKAHYGWDNRIVSLFVWRL